MRTSPTMAVSLVVLLTSANASAEEYDPLAPVTGSEGASVELAVHDEARQREVPLRVYLPAGAKPSPVVLFSHGLGGTRDNCVYLGKHWAARGYVAVFLQHPGSDDSVWKDEPLLKRVVALRRAASGKNLVLGY